MTESNLNNFLDNITDIDLSKYSSQVTKLSADRSTVFIGLPSHGNGLGMVKVYANPSNNPDGWKTGVGVLRPYTDAEQSYFGAAVAPDRKGKYVAIATFNTDNSSRRSAGGIYL